MVADEFWCYLFKLEIQAMEDWCQPHPIPRNNFHFSDTLFIIQFFFVSSFYTWLLKKTFRFDVRPRLELKWDQNFIHFFFLHFLKIKWWMAFRVDWRFIFVVSFWSTEMEIAKLVFCTQFAAPIHHRNAQDNSCEYKRERERKKS